MLQYIPNTMGIKEKVDLENAQRELEQAKATMEYIAMMSDIELIEEDAGTVEGGMPDEPEI